MKRSKAIKTKSTKKPAKQVKKSKEVIALEARYLSAVEFGYQLQIRNVQLNEKNKHVLAVLKFYIGDQSVLKTCDKHDCCPVEQTRGKMGPGDYYDVIAANRIERAGGVPEPEKYGIPIYGKDIGDNRQEHCVEMDESGKDNFRICCKTCGKTTPWGYNDFPGMPGAGADYTRKKWNESI